jgi:hypothetical protein
MSTATNRQKKPASPFETQYLVCWEMDIWAKDPKEAAEKALKVHRDSTSIATIFSVFKDGHYQATVDLTEGTVIQ